MDYVELYRNKTGEEVVIYPEDEGVSNEHGFFYWSKDDTRLLIKAVCGDGTYWESYSDTLCIGFGLSEKWMCSKRSRKAWERKGWTFVRAIPEGNIFKKVVEI